MSEWKTLAFAALELFASVPVIMLIVMGINVQSGISSNMAQQQDMLLVAQEYRTYNRYDETVIYAQDMVSALLEFRGQPTCIVKTSDGGTYTYYPTFGVDGAPTSPISDYSTEELQSRFITARDNAAASETYKCSLVKDENGDVSEVRFVYVAN